LTLFSVIRLDRSDKPAQRTESAPARSISALRSPEILETARLFFRRKAEPHIDAIRKTLASIAFIWALVTSGAFNDMMTSLGVDALAIKTLEIILYVLSVLLIGRILLVVRDLVVGRKREAPASPRVKVEFTARPYVPAQTPVRAADLVRIASLTPAAEEEFSGDTMRAEVVQAAVGNRCALGLRVSDSSGADVGFFDIYHVKDEAMTNWLKGTVYERDMTEQDFEPISAVENRGETSIDFIVGAILMKHGNPVYNYYVAPLIIAAAQHYLAHTLQKFTTVRLFASIFSKAGGRFAEIFGFSLFLDRSQRGPAGKEHDIHCRSFVPNGLDATYFSQSEHKVYVLSLKNV
jgi:hypothetical protein